MRFSSIQYLEWTKTQTGCRINLCPSSIDKVSLSSLSLDLSGLEISGANQYGYAPLVDALASRYGTQPENVVTTQGTAQALFLVCAALLNPGDRVLVEKPAYEPMLSVPAALGAEVTRFERRFEEGFGVDLESYRRELEKRPRLVLLTNLHNPSGAYLRPDELRALARSAEAQGATVLVDEVYLDFLGEPGARSAFPLGKNVIVVSSLTKAYGLGGLRCGWMLAPAALAEKVWKIIDHMHVEGVFLGEQVALQCFSRLEVIRKRHAERIAANFSLLKDLVHSDKRLSWIEPQGGVVGFPRVEAGFDGDRLAEFLKSRYATCVVPGRFFESPRHFRIGFGGSPEEFKQGLMFLGKALDDLSG
jgi:aspartate/methionine/tyrosine aminotransferase